MLHHLGSGLKKKMFIKFHVGRDLEGRRVGEQRGERREEKEKREGKGGRKGGRMRSQWCWLHMGLLVLSPFEVRNYKALDKSGGLCVPEHCLPFAPSSLHVQLSF